MNIQTANRLCELRKKNNLSQEELASKLGVSRQAVSKWERSESSPDTDNLIELAKLYNVSLDELLYGEEAIDVIEENKEADKQEKKDTSNEYVFSKIHGYKVVIDGDDITVTDYSKKARAYSKSTIKEKDERGHRIKAPITGAYSLLVTIAYIILGFVLPNGDGWVYWWFLFITIPVIDSILEVIITKRISSLAYPVLITAIFCALGMWLGLWHPLWVLYITIPVYYIIAEAIDKATHAYDYKVIDEAMDELKENKKK